MAKLTLSKEIEMYEKEVETMTFDQDKNRIMLVALRVQLGSLKKRQESLI